MASNPLVAYPSLSSLSTPPSPARSAGALSPLPAPSSPRASLLPAPTSPAPLATLTFPSLSTLPAPSSPAAQSSPPSLRSLRSLGAPPTGAPPAGVTRSPSLSQYRSPPRGLASYPSLSTLPAVRPSSLRPPTIAAPAGRARSLPPPSTVRSAPPPSGRGALPVPLLARSLPAIRSAPGAYKAAVIPLPSLSDTPSFAALANSGLNRVI